MTALPAADTPSAARPRRWSGYLYLILQAVIVLACLVALQVSPPEPDPRYRLTEATLKRNGTERSIALPAYLPSEPTGDAPYVVALAFDRPAASGDESWSVLVPRFISGIEVAVNGVAILDSRRHPSANRYDRNTPEITVIPDVLMHDGRNELTMRLHVKGLLAGFLDHVFVGPDEALRPSHERRVLLFLTLPVVFAAWQAILAVLLGVMWLKRRHDAAYGVFALAMALGALRAFVPGTISDQLAFSGLNAMLISSAPLEVALMLVFVVTFLGLRCPRQCWLVFLPGLLIAAIAMLGSSAALQQVYLLVGLPSVLLSLLAICAILAWAAVNRGDGLAAVLGCAATLIIVFAVHDLLSVFNFVLDHRIHVARLSYSVMLVAVGVVLTWRFANALNEVDSFASRMVALVREAEDKLRASLALEEQQARAAALAAERTRLMRDLHDGLGGQLVSIVALSERSAWEGDRIGHAARAALRDLRLVIDAMEDIDGDLMLALGTWRERTAAQLRPHGLALEWRVLTAQGMPLHPELRPWHVIQVLRLLDEAITNAVKHAGATRIAVTIETVADAPEGRHGRITVEDDGRGFAVCDYVRPDAPKTARGLANMRRRATQCGAALEISSGPQGTRVRLDLPRVFPSTELTA